MKLFKCAKDELIGVDYRFSFFIGSERSLLQVYSSYCEDYIFKFPHLTISMGYEALFSFSVIFREYIFNFEIFGINRIE